MGNLVSSESVAQPPDGIPSFGDQSRLVDGAIRESYHNKPGEYTARFHPDVNTVWEAFLHGVKLSNNGNCLGYRPSGDEHVGYTWLSYETVREAALNFGYALLKLGLEPREETTVGIYSVNCPEWSEAYLGASSQSMTTVPLYDTLGAESTAYIVEQAEMSVVVCQNAAKALKIAQQPNKFVKHLVVIQDGVTDDLKAKAGEAGMSVRTFEEFLQLGADNPAEVHTASKDGMFLICYTSGTTGVPKGVIISHGNCVAMAAGMSAYVDSSRTDAFGPGKSSISYLPLAHIFEMLVQVVVLSKGGQVGFFRGDVNKLMEDMQHLKPHIFPVVPRLLTKLYDKVQSQVSQGGSAKQWLFGKAYQSKLDRLNRGVITKDTFWDSLVFKKVQQSMGGQVALIVTGAAPIAPAILEFCRVAIGCPIVEGYGQTENTAGACLTLVGDCTPGSVGPPLPSCRIKLHSVPDMNYLAEENKGEVCVQGPTIMRGYFKQPELTADALDADGWLHTGDIGEWKANGSLGIIDRKKHIFKLAQGEYVAPEKIEQVYIRLPLVGQIFVDGSSLQRFLVAVVVPDEEVVRNWFMNNSKPYLDKQLDELCKDAELTDHLLKEMTRFGKANGLSSIEQVKAVHLAAEAFSVENGLLTPTMKSKRPQLRSAYQSAIDALYAQNTG